MEPEKITHVDIPEAEAVEKSEGEEAAPTLSDLAEGGLAPGEIEMAQGQGIIPGDKTKEKPAAAAADGGTGEKAEAKEKEGVDSRFRILSEGKSPEAIMAEIGEKGNLTKEQESVLLASLTKNGQSMYWAQKKERQKRQKVETDSAARMAEKDEEIAALRAQLTKRAAGPALDENGEPIVESEEDRAAREAAAAVEASLDPKKKPLTIEDFERMEKEKAEKLADETKRREERSGQIREALNFQQEDAKTRYADFDQATEKVADILRAANAGKLEDLYPDPKTCSRVFQKCRELLLAYAKADQFEEGDYNAADMTYDLAKEHPEFGEESPRTNASKKSETGADGTPESARRVLSNANRRGSSATLNGGGSRRIPLEDLTAEQARRLPTNKWNKLPLATREKLLGKI